MGVPSAVGAGPQPQALNQKCRVAVGGDGDRREGVSAGDIGSGDVAVRWRGTDSRQWQSDAERGEARRDDEGSDGRTIPHHNARR